MEYCFILFCQYMHTSSFVIGESIKTGWNITKKYFWIILLLMIISNLPSLLSNLFDTILPYIPGATRMVYSQLQGTEIAEPVGIRSMIVTTLFIVASILGARL